MNNFITINSIVLKEISYDKESNSLFIRFHTGKLYEYFFVSEEIYNNFLNADSKGKYFNDIIKSNFKCKQK